MRASCAAPEFLGGGGGGGEWLSANLCKVVLPASQREMGAPGAPLLPLVAAVAWVVERSCLRLLRGNARRLSPRAPCVGTCVRARRNSVCACHACACACARPLCFTCVSTSLGRGCSRQSSLVCNIKWFAQHPQSKIAADSPDPKRRLHM